MLFAVASLVLSAILMTQADVNDIVSDVTNIKPLSEELYIFEVSYDAQVADLKNALELANVEVRHSLRVLGTHQYLFVIVDDGSDALSQLNFPKGSLVTQYPVELVEDFFKMVGVGDWKENDTAEAFGDKNLVLATFEFFFPEGTSTSQLKSRMKAVADTYREVTPIIKYVHYAVVGGYPVKHYSLMNLDANALQKSILDGLEAFGGPGNIVINVLRLGKV